MLERSPAEAILVDLVFLGFAVWVWRSSADDGRSRRDMAGYKKVVLIGAGGLALGLTVLMLLAGPSGLQAATAGEQHPKMQSVDFDQGDHLVYLFHHECPQCAKMSPLVPQLSHVRDGEIARTWSIVFPDLKDLRDLLSSDKQG
jgi:hypothetical protein